MSGTNLELVSDDLDALVRVIEPCQIGLRSTRALAGRP